MRIAGTILPANSLQQLRKDQSDQAQQSQLDNLSSQDQRIELARREEFAQQNNPFSTRSVEASAEIVRTSRLQRLDEEAVNELPRRNQIALQTFLDNTPSPEEQLGIEIAGVDTFV